MPLTKTEAFASTVNPSSPAPVGPLFLVHLRMLAALAVAAVTLVLQACAGAPPAEAPLAPIELPAQFSASGEQVLPLQWWQVFDDPALDRLEALALADNFSLAAAQARLARARALAAQAGAERIPKLDASAQAGVSRADGTASSERYGLGLAAAYEVDLWGRIDAGVRSAEAELVAVENDLHTAAISLTAELANRYFELQQELATFELLGNQKGTNQRIAELIRLRFLNGQSDIDELLRQQQLVSQTESQLLQSQAQAELLTQQIAVLTGQTPTRKIEPGARTEPMLPPLPATGVPLLWLQQRPDIQAAFARLEAADAALARAVSAQYPRLNLGVDLETTASRPGALFENWLASLTAGLTAPLIDGGNLRAQVEQAGAARDLALADYRQTVLEGLQEVEAALLAERRDQGMLAHLEVQLELAQAALEQLTFRYRQGAAAYLDVLSTLTSVQSLERQRVALAYELMQDRVALNRALAGYWTQQADDSRD
ncbi:MAG: transporter [Alteromonadaceae bacterium]|nr:transporter [Alteromonadaceae bacterium]|tara:strand:- start:1346 stop:2809 length:1464 start_codon:yes stop_codon:yes gene_type:complete